MAAPTYSLVTKSHGLELAIGLACGLAACIAAVYLTASSVPLIELDGSERSRSALLRAASELGVARVRVATFMDGADIARALDASTSLFSIDDTTKKAWPVVRFPPAEDGSAPIARGYIPLAGEAGVKADFVELKEGFALSNAFGCDNAGMSTLNFCNSWPSGADEFRNSSTRLLAGMSRIAHAAAGELAVALGVPGGGSDVVASLEAGLASSVMRVFHYHSADHCSRARREECAGARTRTGSSPHTDWHAITVIAEDLRVERSDWWRTWMQGLQFRPRGNSRWHRVHTEEGEVVVIFGDLLALASAGRVYSPVHRVVLGARARTSYTYFAYPRSGDTIADWARILAHSDHRGGGAAAVDVDTLFAAARAAASTVPWNTLMAGAGAISAYEPFERILLRKWRGVST